MNDQLIQRIHQCATLPSLPAIAVQVLDLAQKADVDITEIARTISKDAALSSKILRTVNSSFYSRSHKISTMSHALVVLGLQSVKTLVLGFSLVTNLPKSKSKSFKYVNYWKRSVYAATTARMLAARLQIAQQEECFLAALLMDIGMLVLDQVLIDEYGDVSGACESHPDLLAAEQAAFQMTHADVSGLLADHWKLPPLLATPMLCHHRPAEVKDPALRRITEIAFLAGRCADVFVDKNPGKAILDTRAFALENFQIAEADCDKLLEEIGQRTRENAPLFDLNLGNTASFESILKKANDALVELTLRSQQQAETLQVQNQALKVKAATDGLTGLSNRAEMDEFLAAAFSSAKFDGKPLAFLLLDVDRFKSINDRYGHPVGDRVLKSLARLIRAAGRKGDLAARYGGEELVLVLPNTNRATATALAETIRRAIAFRPIQCGSLKIQVTASIGVAVYEVRDEACPFREPAHLIKAADLAVYAAKHGGRNRVRVFNPRPIHPNAAIASALQPPSTKLPAA